MSKRKVLLRGQQAPRPAPRDPGQDMTQQQFKSESDINNITSRYIRTGVTGNPQSGRQPIFADFASAEDFQTTLNAVMDAQTSFMMLPSSIRRKFRNDPYQMMRFVEKEENREEAEKLGLIDPAKIRPKVDPIPTPKEGEGDGKIPLE